MANEIAASYIAGRLVMTADVYQPDGTEREYAIALTEITTGSDGLYLGDCATIVAGDLIVIYDDGVVVGGGEYLPDLSTLDTRFDDIDTALDDIEAALRTQRNVYDETPGGGDTSGASTGASSGVYPSRC